MKMNVGTIDRVVRIIMGLVIIGLGVYFNSLWGALGLVPLATGTFRVCPAYMPFGLSTCKVAAKDKA